jgi:hypothetical protein
VIPEDSQDEARGLFRGLALAMVVILALVAALGWPRRGPTVPLPGQERMTLDEPSPVPSSGQRR